MVTLIYRFPFSNYLREEIDERFDLLDLSRFGGLPGECPGAPFKTRGRLLGDWFAGITELHEVDAFWYFRFEDELCPLDI